MAGEPDNKSIIGKVFERLTVISYSHKIVYKTPSRNRSEYYFNCQCSCGNMKVATKACLLQGSTKSCGCLKREVSAAEGRSHKGKPQLKRRLPDGGRAFNTILSKYKERAIRRNIPFLISKEFFKNITLQNCFYCGEPGRTIIDKTSVLEKYNGIDRLDNKKGYTEDNCLPCCKICNYMKLTLSYEEFIGHIQKISNFQK